MQNLSLGGQSSRLVAYGKQLIRLDTCRYKRKPQGTLQHKRQLTGFINKYHSRKSHSTVAIKVPVSPYPHIHVTYDTSSPFIACDNHNYHLTFQGVCKAIARNFQLGTDCMATTVKHGRSKWISCVGSWGTVLYC